MYIVYKDYPVEGDNWFNYENQPFKEFNKSIHAPTGSMFLLCESYAEHSMFYESYELDWTLEFGSVSPLIFDIEKAKTKFIEDIRNSRVLYLSNLDVYYMKALESGNQTTISDIITKKQQLRDLPTMDLSDVTTLSELINKWPTELIGNSPYEN
jgi:hypothetical protein